MMNYSQIPRDDDVMLGSAHFAPSDSVMLGGIEGLKQQFKQKTVEIRIQAIQKAVKYENKGVDLILQGLKDPAFEVQKVAYFILQDYQKNKHITQDNFKKITKGLKQYIPYNLYQCCSTLKAGKKCVISNNGETIAFFTGKKIRVFDLNSKELLYVIETNVGNRDFFELSYDPDILIKVNNSSGHLVEIWEQDQLIHSLHEHFTDINTIALSKDGTLLATATRDATIKIWRVKTGKSLLSFRSNLTVGNHKGIINCLTFTEDSNTLISSSQDGTIKLWNLKMGTNIRTLKCYGNKIVLSPDNLTLAVADLYGSIHLIDISTGKLITILRGHLSPVQTMIFSEYGRILISGGKDNLIKFWSMYSKTEINSLDAHKKTITGLTFSPDYKYLISVSDDNTVKKWGVLNS